MSHIKNLYIGGYRGIQELEIDNLSQFNLLIGKNNVGKTSILESIELLSKPGNLFQFILTSRGRDRALMLSSRKISTIDSVLWTFPMKYYESFNKISRKNIHLKAQLGFENIEYKIDYNETTTLPINNSILSKKKEMDVDEFEEVRALELFFHTNINQKITEDKEIITDRQYNKYHTRNDQFFKTKLVSPVDHRILPISAKALSNSIMAGEKNSIINLLQDFDECIQSIELLSPDGNNTIPYFKHRTMGFVPVSVYGDGIRRILTIATAIIQARGNILLIDEIETAIHSRLFKKFFNWLIINCKEYNIQLFITTHSLEAIDAILSADIENLNELTTYRLEKSNEGEATFSKRFIGEDMYSLRYELGQDVR